MNPMRRFHIHVFLALALLLLMPASPVRAQSVDGLFATQINPGAGTGGVDQLQVSVELAASPSFDLGSATLMFTFNEAALGIPSAPEPNTQLAAGDDYQFEDPFVGDPGNGKFYGPSTVTVFGQPDRLSINVVLEVTGAGQPLPVTSTPIVTLFFDIVDPTQTAGLAWVLPASGDPNPTEVFAEDNVTAAALGTFTDDSDPLPVELVTFEATVDAQAVELTWSTASEANNAGFSIMRQDECRTPKGCPWEEIAFVEGHGTTTEPRDYAYRVTGLSPELHRFRLKQVDLDGTSAYSPEVEVTIELAGAFLLSAPYPNPFRRTAHFSLAVRQRQEVVVEVFDVLGRHVTTLYDGSVEAHRSRPFVLEGGDLPSGIYLIRVTGETFAATRRVTVLR